jgi:hypothetical protein
MPFCMASRRSTLSLAISSSSPRSVSPSLVSSSRSRKPALGCRTLVGGGVCAGGEDEDWEGEGERERER